MKHDHPTACASSLVCSFVYGFVLQEVSLPFDSADEFADLAVDVFLPQLPLDQYPYLNEAAATLAAAGYAPRTSSPSASI